MFLLLTTIDGKALINMDDVHAISPYIENLKETDSCDLWWKDHMKDAISMRAGDRCTFVEESLEEICALLAGISK
jgi:hypothetical protein